LNLLDIIKDGHDLNFNFDENDIFFTINDLYKNFKDEESKELLYLTLLDFKDKAKKECQDEEKMFY